MNFDDIDWERWEPQQQATLLFVLRDDQILLIRKKRGIGAGKLNGPGGRVNDGESAYEAAIREVQEELCVTPSWVSQAGELLFQVVDGVSIRIHVFRASGCDGEPQETDEAAPRWTPVDAIPYDEMWEDDKLWFPHLLAGRWFEARTLFDDDTLIGHQILT